MEVKHLGHKIISYHSFLKKIGDIINSEMQNDCQNELKKEMEKIIERFCNDTIENCCNLKKIINYKQDKNIEIKKFYIKEFALLQNSTNYQENNERIKKFLDCFNFQSNVFLPKINEEDKNLKKFLSHIKENFDSIIVILHKSFDYDNFLMKREELNEKKSNTQNCTLDDKLVTKLNLKKGKSENQNNAPPNTKENEWSNEHKIFQIQRKIKIHNQEFIYDGISGDKKYLRSEEVICSFCQESSKNSQLIIKLGPIFGPYTSKKYKLNSYFVHESCALWASGIILDEKNSIQNSLEEHILAAEKIRCRICKKKGAASGCNFHFCQNSYHFKCICDNNDIHFNLKKFLVYCPDHTPGKKK